MNQLFSLAIFTHSGIMSRSVRTFIQILQRPWGSSRPTSSFTSVITVTCVQRIMPPQTLHARANENKEKLRYLCFFLGRRYLYPVLWTLPECLHDSRQAKRAILFYWSGKVTALVFLFAAITAISVCDQESCNRLQSLGGADEFNFAICRRMQGDLCKHGVLVGFWRTNNVVEFQKVYIVTDFEKLNSNVAEHPSILACECVCTASFDVVPLRQCDEPLM